MIHMINKYGHQLTSNTITMLGIPHNNSKIAAPRGGFFVYDKDPFTEDLFSLMWKLKK